MNVIFLKLYSARQVISVIKGFLVNLNWKVLRLRLIKMDFVMKKIFMLLWKHCEMNLEMMDSIFLVKPTITVNAIVNSIVILQRMSRKPLTKKANRNN